MRARGATPKATYLILHEGLPEFDDAFRAKAAAAAAASRAGRAEALARLDREIAQADRQLANITDALARGGFSPARQARLAETEVRKARLEAERADLLRQPDDVPVRLPVEELKERARAVVGRMAFGEPGFGRLMTTPVSRLEVLPYRPRDGGAVVLRADAVINSAPSGGPSAGAAFGGLIRREATIDLFDPPQRVAFLERVVALRDASLTERAAAERLGLTPVTPHARLTPPDRPDTCRPHVRPARHHRAGRFRFPASGASRCPTKQPTDPSAAPSTSSWTGWPGPSRAISRTPRRPRSTREGRSGRAASRSPTGRRGDVSPHLEHLTLDRPLAFLDVESTGVDPAADRVVEVAVLTVLPRGAPESYHPRVNPGVPIPAAATAVHGIAEADVAGAEPSRPPPVIPTRTKKVPPMPTGSATGLTPVNSLLRAAGARWRSGPVRRMSAPQATREPPARRPESKPGGPHNRGVSRACAPVVPGTGRSRSCQICVIIIEATVPARPPPRPISNAPPLPPRRAATSASPPAGCRRPTTRSSTRR